MSILSVDNISPIGSGTSVTVNSAATLVLTNANSTGVVTATSFVGSGANLTGVLSNIVEDTSPQLGANLDTNTKCIDFGDSNTGTVNRLRFGASTDFEIFHNGTNNHIDCHTAGQDLYIRPTKDVYIQDYVTDDIFIKMIKDGAVELYHNDIKKLNTKSTGVSVSGVLEFENGHGTYVTNSNSTWQTLFTFSNANNNGFSMECAVAENNYSTIYKVGGTAMWNSCYFTSDHAGDSNHAHSSDIEFRVLNDSGTKRLQFKAVSYTTTRYLTVISLWVKSGSVTWS